MCLGSVICGFAHAAPMGCAVLVGGIVTKMVLVRVGVSDVSLVELSSGCCPEEIVGDGELNFEAGIPSAFVVFAVLRHLYHSKLLVCLNFCPVALEHVIYVLF